jgi:adenylate cyclase
MKFTFRTTLLSILFSLIVLTVSALIGSSHYYSSRSAQELLGRVLEQASQTIYNQIHRLLDTAEDRTKLNQRLLQDGVFDVRDFPRLAEYWLDVMEISPELSLVSLTLDETGEAISVERSHDGQLFVHEVGKNNESQQFESATYTKDDYSQSDRAARIYDDASDARRQAWYLAAKHTGKETWTPTYVFEEQEGRFGMAGVTCATPIYDDQGELAGVVTADFDVYELCQYLRQLRGIENGFVFIIELRENGTRVVIAQPNSATLLEETVSEDGSKQEKLVPAAENQDPRIREFVKQIPHLIERGNLAQFAPVAFTLEGRPYVGGYRYVAGNETPEWLVCVVLPESEVMQHVWQNSLISVLVGLVIFVVAVLTSVYVARQVSRPLEIIAKETEAIGKLQVEPRKRVSSVVLEVDRLGAAVEEMKTGLRSFQKYVPSDLVRELLNSKNEARLGGERRTVTIFFSDIVNFTGISENLSPEQLIDHLSEYLRELSAQVIQTSGTVDKYIGDAIMAFWGAPAIHPQHAIAACTTALGCQSTLRKLRTKWITERKPALHSRIGIHTGKVVVGNIGSDVRLNYTVIGDAVNLASRLEGLNKFYGTEMIISETTYQEAQSAIVARPIDWVAVKGRAEPVLVYELLGLKGEVNGCSGEVVELSTLALAGYRKQDWAGAVRHYERLVQLRPGDLPALQMIARCREYQSSPPGDDWDGVYHLEVK